MPNWTKDMDEILRAELGKGELSFSEISKLIGCTRHACIGRANRLGVKSIRSSGGRKPPKAIEPDALPLIPEPIQEVQPEPTQEVQPEPKVQIIDLTPFNCHWPIGNPMTADFHFCGKPMIKQPYCQEHAAMAYVVPARRR